MMASADGRRRGRAARAGSGACALVMALLLAGCDLPVGEDTAPPAASEPATEDPGAPETPPVTDPVSEEPSAEPSAPAEEPSTPAEEPSAPAEEPAESEEPTTTTPTAGVPEDAVWVSSEQWGMWNDNDYILYNNIWGSGAGTQTIWANSFSNWGVHADHPDTGGVKSYPNATLPVDAQLSTLSSVTSTFDVTVPQAGAYTSTYDIWAGDGAYEIMVWVNQFGPVGPIGSLAQSGVEVGGHTFDVYRGTNGSFEVFSFLRTENTSSGTVDVLGITDWIQDQGWFGDVVLDEVQFGYEITSASGGLDFVTNAFSVDVE